MFTLLEQAAEQLRKACETCGFFYLIGHGVATELTQNALNASRQFFALPEGDKLSAYNYDGVILDDPPNFRGYRSLGQVALDPNNQVGSCQLLDFYVTVSRYCDLGMFDFSFQRIPYF